MSQPATEMFSIFNSSQALDALRAAGFRSTAEAIFELIDNSIEAQADYVEVFGVEHQKSGSDRPELKELAVMDNGVGMTPDELRQSLRFGAGTRFERKGMGRYGVGLPQSSMSQADRVEVWSWQNGVTNAMYTYLDVPEIRAGSHTVPEPAKKPIPAHFLRHSTFATDDTETAGTLVLWTKLHRTTWKTAAATFRNTQPLVGRVYRNFLATGRDRLESVEKAVSIDMYPIYLGIDGEPNDDLEERDKEANVTVKPNDPLFLMMDTSSNEDFGEGPMFEEMINSGWTQEFTVNGKQFNCVVRASHARRHAREKTDEAARWPDQFVNGKAGMTPWGKRAKDNMGVSIVRANRELDLDRRWVETAEEVNRWWKVEVAFPPELDEIFGVTNNKQAAHNFSSLANWFENQSFQYDHYRINDESDGEVRQRLQSGGDQTAALIEVATQVKKFITAARKNQETYMQGTGKGRHLESPEGKSDSTATRKIKLRKDGGYLGESDDKADGKTADQIQVEMVEQLANNYGYTDDEALRIAIDRAELGYNVQTVERALDGDAFFAVTTTAGQLYIEINSNHPFYEELWKATEISEEEEELTQGDALQRLRQVQQVLRIALYAFGRTEDESSNKEHLRRVRNDWGLQLNGFLTNDDLGPR